MGNAASKFSHYYHVYFYTEDFSHKNGKQSWLPDNNRYYIVRL